MNRGVLECVYKIEFINKSERYNNWLELCTFRLHTVFFSINITIV